MKTYSIKVALQGISPMVWRRFRITGDTSLASLHFLIQIAQGWTDDYLHTFHIYGRDYGIYHDGGISFQDNAFQVKIDDFEFDVSDKLGLTQQRYVLSHRKFVTAQVPQRIIFLPQESQCDSLRL